MFIYLKTTLNHVLSSISMHQQHFGIMIELIGTNTNLETSRKNPKSVCKLVLSLLLLPSSFLSSFFPFSSLFLDLAFSHSFSSPLAEHSRKKGGKMIQSCFFLSFCQHKPIPQVHVINCKEWPIILALSLCLPNDHALSLLFLTIWPANTM